MALNNPTPGPSVQEFLVSAIPYVTSSTVANGVVKVHDFNYITSFFTIKNTSAQGLAVGFTQLGVQGTNRIVLGQNESFSGDFRVKSIFLLGAGSSASSYELVAGLTSVSSRHMPTLTGSLGLDGVG